MDLTKYLRPSRKVNQPLERKEQYKNQGKTNALDRNKRTQKLANNRKENRSKQILSRRGIENTEAEEVSFSEDQEGQQSLAAQKTKTGNSDRDSRQEERLKRLEEYREKQKAKKEREKAKKIKPFLAGITGLRSSESDLYTSSTKNLGSSSTKRIMGSSSSKKLNLILPRALQDNNKKVFKFTGKSCQGNENTASSDLTKASNTLPAVEFHKKEPTSSPVAVECDSEKNMIYNTPNNLTTVKENRFNTPYPVDTRMSTPEDTDHDDSMKSGPNISMVDNALNDEEIEESRDIVTPLRPPKSTKRIASNMKDNATTPKGNYQPITPDVCTERGSFSSRRKAQSEKSTRRSIAEELNFDDVFNDENPEEATSTTETVSTKDTCITQKDAVIIQGEQQNESKNKEHSISSPKQMDVPYFKSLLSKETEKLNSRSQEWENKLNLFNAYCTADNKSMTQKKDIDAIEGQIRATIGKANILMNKKGRFQQFKDLISNCEFDQGEKKTTCTDLQGFWEMIYYEVEKIIKDFSDLDTIEKDGWKITKSEPIIPERKINKKLIKKPTITNGEKKVSTAKKPSSNIKEIMAMKRKEMALAKKQSMEAEIIGDVKTSSAAEKLPSPLIDMEKEKVFDGGFFNVQSPVSSLKNTPNSMLTSIEQPTEKSNLEGSPRYCTPANR